MTDSAEAPAAGDRYLVPALQRGLQLLLQFSRQDRELTGAELSRRLGLPRASVFRFLQTLEQMGFLERQPDGSSYRLGLAVLRLGFEFLASMELAEHARPVLHGLRDQTGLSAHLVVRDLREVVFVAKAPGHSALFNSIQVGARLPAHATVLGRVLLGGMNRQALQKLYQGATLDAFTDRTPVTVAQLERLVEADYARGYGVSQGGFDPGISTIAAPVFNAQEQITAAISVTVPAQSVAQAELIVLAEQVRAAARQLSMSGPRPEVLVNPASGLLRA